MQILMLHVYKGPNVAFASLKLMELINHCTKCHTQASSQPVLSTMFTSPHAYAGKNAVLSMKFQQISSTR